MPHDFTEQVDNLTCREMLHVIRHYLTQDASGVLSCALYLLNEKGPGFVNQEQKNVIDDILVYSESLRQIENKITSWLLAHPQDV